MTLDQALEKIRELNQHAAVYEDLIHHVNNSDFYYEGASEVVTPYVKEVIVIELEKLQSKIADQKKAILARDLKEVEND